MGHFEVLDGGKTIKCKLCPPDDAWESVHNATRASKHLGDKHKLGVKPKLESDALVEPVVLPSFEAETSSTSSPSFSTSASVEQPVKKSKLFEYFDRPFTQDQQGVAERAHALYVVMNGYSYHSQQQPWAHAFFRSLRADYVPPSATTALIRN